MLAAVVNILKYYGFSLLFIMELCFLVMLSLVIHSLSFRPLFLQLKLPSTYTHF